jgi:hypothetical protein
MGQSEEAKLTPAGSPQVCSYIIDAARKALMPIAQEFLALLPATKILWGALPG